MSMLWVGQPTPSLLLRRRQPPRRPPGRATITDLSVPPNVDVLLSADEVHRRIEALADKLAPKVSQGSWTAVVILLGATPFAADLMRAFARRGIDMGFDGLWLESYADARESSGRMLVRADVARPVEGRGILLVDDVFDSGRTISFARDHMLHKGASEVLTCVFARKPEAVTEGLDAWAWDAPHRYLVGYGMDDAGKMRGLPFVGAIRGA
ncbi:MAG TPA: phosphoribosyltransferase family protein [Hyphomonadaceae bacterium]|nr:phosphoribosyltransferase family protein [Hyphomonadaceae bacterium]HPI50227.1 phosphoribosyltransferase family protein [Hyphomonadaceae bacterium]